MSDPTTTAARPLPADVAGMVERATAALDGVTPGPWVAVRASHGPVDVFSGDRDIVTFYGTNSGNDARFIAAARQLVPDLMAAIKAQARQIADLTARAEKAEAENTRLREALINAAANLATVARSDQLGSPQKWQCQAWSDDALAAMKGGDNG